MPFSLLLLIYMIFAFISHDKFELLPLLICALVGLICGYFDYNRYLVDKNIVPIVCVLTVILFSSLYIVDFNFNMLLVVVALAALSMGAMINIVLHSTHILKKKSSELQAIMDQSIQTIWELNYQNSQLSSQNTLLETNLATIANEKKSTEAELLSLVKNTAVMQANLKEISQSRQDLEAEKARLIDKERALNEKLAQQNSAKHTEDNAAIAKGLKEELEHTLRALLDNEQEKTVNAAKLQQTQKSLTVQTAEKGKLEEKIQEILKEQNALIASTTALKYEKETIQNRLQAVQNEIDFHKATNQKNEQTIASLSLENRKLRINEDFLNKWLETEILLIKHAYPSNARTPVTLINHYNDIGKIDRALRDDLHELRMKRNDKNHKLNTKIYEQDVRKVEECYNRLLKRLS